MIKHYIAVIRDNRTALLGLLFAVILSFTILKPLGLVLCVLGWAYVWPFGKLANSYFLRVVLSFCLSSAFIQLIGVIYWALDIHLTVIHAIATQGLGIVTVLLMRGRSKPAKFITRSDVAALIAVFITIAFIGMGTFAKPLTPHLIKASTSAFDDTIHTSLSLTVYDNQGYLYATRDKVIDKVIYDALVAYPQGWYLSNGVWWHSFTDRLDSTKSVRNVALFYLVSKLAWYCLVIFLFCRLMLSLAAYIGIKLNLLMYSSSILLTLLAEVLLFFGIYKFGFSSFLPVLVFNLALVFVIFGRSEEEGLGPALITGLMFCGASSMSWLLAAPASYAALGLTFLDSFNYHLKRVWLWAVSSWRLLLGAIAITLLGFAQIGMQLKFSVNNNLINTDGGIWPINVTLLLVIFTLLVIFIGSEWGKKIQGLLFVIAPAAILTALIYTYQYATAGRATYYSTKAGYMPYMLLLLAGSVLLMYGINRSLRQQGFLLGFVVVLSLICIVPYTLNIDLRVLGSVSGRTHKLSLYSAEQIATIAQNGDLKGNVVVYKNLDYEEDLLTTNYLTMLNRKQSECQRMLIWFTLSKQYGELEKQIPKCADETTGSRYYVITSSLNYDRLSTLYASTPKVEVILSN